METNNKQSIITQRERALKILNYQDYDRMPVIIWGFWNETLAKWQAEGHITEKMKPRQVAEKLGADFNWNEFYQPPIGPVPHFERKIIEKLPDGSQKVLNWCGVVILETPGAGSIPMEFDRLFKGRKEWEAHYKWRYEVTDQKVLDTTVRIDGVVKPLTAGGLEMLKPGAMDVPVGIFSGSLIGHIRDFVGVDGLAYLAADDEPLLDEMIETVANNAYNAVEKVLAMGARFDYGHFWEDMCFKNGPLISPAFFAEKIGPHYKRIVDLLRKHGTQIFSVDCDGKIDLLIPTWLKNGVNTMFPIEVGTWDADIAPWRKQFGKELRGVGGMDKRVLAFDYAAIDREIERLKPLVELGGYIPCPDHAIPPDAKWENVQYYVEKFRKAF